MIIAARCPGLRPPFSPNSDFQGRLADGANSVGCLRLQKQSAAPAGTPGRGLAAASESMAWRRPGFGSAIAMIAIAASAFAGTLATTTIRAGFRLFGGARGPA